MTIEARIRDAYAKTRSYHGMLNLVFPAERYPKARRISNNGGPPGCAMAFGAAIRRMGGRRDGDNVYLPPLPRKEELRESARRAFDGIPWRGHNDPPDTRR